MPLKQTGTPEETLAMLRGEEAKPPAATGWKDLPEGFGYYWIRKGNGTIKLIHLCPGDGYESSGGRCVEAWNCPGCGRYRLDWINLPRWKWFKVEQPAKP